MSAKPASPKPAEVAPKKSKKMLFIIIGVVLALAGGGGTYYFMAAKKAAAEAAEDSGQSKDKTQAKRPIFVPLDPFTVNLADAGSEKMAQISINLQVSDPKLPEEIKAFMPAIRHIVLKIISSKESREILTGEGKEKLAEEIAIATALPLGWAPEDDEMPVAEKPKKPLPEKDKLAATEGAEKSEKNEEKSGDKPTVKAAGSDKSKSKKMKRRAPPPNPIEQVHFSQFIVQ